MSETLTIETAHQFYYSTEEGITPKALAESLLGLEDVVSHSLKTLCKHIGVSPVETKILIKDVGIDSIFEEIAIKLLFGTGDKVDEKIEQLRKRLGLDKIDDVDISEVSMKGIFWKTLIGTTITAMAVYGVCSVLTSEETSDPKTQVIINNSFNSIGGKVNLSGEEIQEIITAALPKTHKEELKKSTIKMLSPDGVKPQGSVTIDGEENFIIPSELVEKVPQKYEKPKEDDPWEKKLNVDIVIRAMDLDSDTKGWAAIVSDISNSRVKLTLGENVEAKTLSIGQTFTGDIIVIYRKTKTGKTPKEYQLIKKK